MIGLSSNEVFDQRVYLEKLRPFDFAVPIPVGEQKDPVRKSRVDPNIKIGEHLHNFLLRNLSIVVRVNGSESGVKIILRHDGVEVLDQLFHDLKPCRDGSKNILELVKVNTLISIFVERIHDLFNL